MSEPEILEERRVWGRGLDLFAVISLAVALFGVVTSFRVGVLNGLLVVAVCAIAVFLVLRIRSGGSSWEPYGLVAACLG